MIEVIYTVFVCAFVVIAALGHVLVLAAIIGPRADCTETGRPGKDASRSGAL